MKGMRFVNSSTAATLRQMAERGRVKKTLKLPWDRSSNCLMATSSNGPRMKAKQRGAGSKPNFRIRYPRTPNPNISAKSIVDRLMAYAPMMQKRMIIGKMIR